MHKQINDMTCIKIELSAGCFESKIRKVLLKEIAMIITLNDYIR